MALPFSRNTDYVPTDPVLAADLDDIQDAIAAQHNRPIHFWASSFAPHTNVVGVVQSGTGLSHGGVGTDPITGSVDVTPFLIPGDTIKELVARYNNGSTPTAGNVTVSLIRDDVAAAGAGSTTVATATYDATTGGADAYQNRTLDCDDHVVLADMFYRIEISIAFAAADDGAAIIGTTLVLEVP